MSLALPVGMAIAAACSAGGGPSPSAESGSGGSGASAAAGGGNGHGGTGGQLVLLDSGPPPGPVVPGTVPPRLCEICNDLPADPIFVEGAPANAPDLFGPPENVSLGTGPCIAEPAPGTLFPNNWLRPRIRWTAGGDLYEVRISTARQANDLVVYTPHTEYYIPREVWNGVEGVSQGLARNNYEEDVVVTVRAINTATGGTPAGSQTYFRTAAVDAGGSMVYWALTSSEAADSWLKGFAVGDEATVDTLRPNQVTTQSRNYLAQPKAVECIGCHTSTPDGDAVAFVEHWPWAGMLSYVTEERVGQLPDYVTPAGLIPFQQLWLGIPTFSPAHWEEGRRLAITTFGEPTGIGWTADDGIDFNATNQDRLMWVNLAATAPEPVPTDIAQLAGTYIQSAQGVSFGFLARNGDSRAANSPDWSHEGSLVAYTSTSTTSDGCLGAVNDTDIYTVPFNDGAGGDVAPMPGASQPNVGEYYPAFSSDDAFVAFNHVDNVTSLQGNLYYRPEGEVWIVSAPGAPGVAAAAGEISAGGAIRLKANDPNICSGEVSPGVINSWAKWSPRVSTVDGKAYYWLIFSSAREAVGVLPPGPYSPPDTRYSQLYMAAFTVQNGEVTTYPAIYLWNQSRDTSNLTPAWDEFDIPEVPLPEIPR